MYDNSVSHLTIRLIVEVFMFRQKRKRHISAASDEAYNLKNDYYDAVRDDYELSADRLTIIKVRNNLDYKFCEKVVEILFLGINTRLWPFW